jgi:hypothetical protein
MVDFDYDKTSPRKVFSNKIFFMAIFFSMTKNPQITRENFQNMSISDKISISKTKKPEFCFPVSEMI